MKKEWIVYIALLTLLGMICFFPVTQFAFWKDDWWMYWTATYDVKSLWLAWALHPGTNVVHWVLYQLFHDWIIGWQSVGIMLRIVSSIVVSKWVYRMTKNKTTGMITGFLFAVTPLGADAVGWVNIYLMSILIIAYCLTWMKWKDLGERRTMKNTAIAVIFLLISTILDPVRIIPFVACLLWWSLMKKTYIPKKLLWISSAGAIAIAVAWAKWFSSGNGLEFISHPHMIGNIFHSLLNFFLTMFVPLQEIDSRIPYDQMWARIGIGMVMIWIGVLVYGKRKASKETWEIVSTMSLWIVSMYGINWIVQPQITITGTHRYMALSAVGAVTLLAYGIAKIQYQWMQMIVFLSILALQMGLSYRFIARLAPIRNATIVDAIWKEIDAHIPRGNDIAIYIEGDETMVEYEMKSSGIFPLAMIKRLKDPKEFPLLMTDSKEATAITTGQKKSVEILGKTYDIPVPFDQNNIYTFSLDEKGIITFLPTVQQLNNSTIQQLNNETIQQLNNSPTQQYYDVIRVVDGDTIVVLIEGKKETVRLIGIDTPEVVDPRKPVQCFGKEASNKTKELVSGKRVRLDKDVTQQDRDTYKRLLRYVYLEDNTLVNKILIDEGFAHEYTYVIPYTLQKEFREAERQASNQKIGLWKDDACKDALGK